MRTAVLFSLGILLASRTWAQETSAPLRRATDTFGTTTDSYYRISSTEFTPAKSATSYADMGVIDNTWTRYSTVPIGLFVASPHLPSGAVLTSFELDSCDFNGVSDVFATLQQCAYTGGGCTVHASLLSSDNATPNSCSYALKDISALGPLINNYGGETVITVETQAGDSTNRFAGVILGYRLQVAPSPATATFDDVPTTYPYFQFIEALSSWGITSGCSTNPPQYCPERPITRGEMAVYMAKALGLYLPQY